MFFAVAGKRGILKRCYTCSAYWSMFNDSRDYSLKHPINNDVTKEAIAIIIPTYNEKKNVKQIIGAIKNILPTSHIVIVDDNSPDLTGKEVSVLAEKHSNIHLIARKEKSGRGSAVIAGFTYALKNTKAHIFIEMDADFSHDPQELSQLIDKVNDTTFVIASRYLSLSKIYGWPVSRRILSSFANLLIHFLLKIPIHDYTNGYRAYSRKAVEILVKHTFVASGYIVLSESIVVLYKNGFTSIEVPTSFVNRKEGVSKTGLGENVHSFKSIMDIWLKTGKLP